MIQISAEPWIESVEALWLEDWDLNNCAKHLIWTQVTQLPLPTHFHNWIHTWKATTAVAYICLSFTAAMMTS